MQLSYVMFMYRVGPWDLTPEIERNKQHPSSLSLGAAYSIGGAQFLSISGVKSCGPTLKRL